MSNSDKPETESKPNNLVNEPNTQSGAVIENTDGHSSYWNTLMLSKSGWACVLGLLVFIMLLCYAYCCFYENQYLPETFIEKTIKSGADADRVFDIDGEVNKLREVQEQYLNGCK